MILQTGITTATMKMLSNNKGMSLVILIIAMTLIAILGASFVSLVGSKHKGFIYQNNAYQALNIANAGVEYAIRHISDGLSDASDSYFQDTPINIDSIGFGGGSFSIRRNYNITIASDYIEAVGIYPYPVPVSTRKVKLTNFRRYLKTITLVPGPSTTYNDRKPKRDTNTKIIKIPIINNNNSIVISKISLRTDVTGLYLQYINIDEISQYLFDYTTRGECPLAPQPCKDISNNGVSLTNTFKDFPLDITYSQLSNDTIRIISITLTMTVPTGNYEIKFYDLANNEIGYITFPI